MDLDFLKRVNSNYNVLKDHCVDISFNQDYGIEPIFTIRINENQLGNIVISERSDITAINDEINVDECIDNLKRNIFGKHYDDINLKGPTIDRLFYPSHRSDMDTHCGCNNTSKNRKDNNMKQFEIKKVEVLNGRVVLMRFWDGTFTKAICTEDDFNAGKFDIDIGITICIIKKMLGETDGKPKAYSKALKDIHRMMDAEEKHKKEEEERVRIAKERRKRKAVNRAIRELRASDAKKHMITEAIVEADKILKVGE